MKDHKGTIIKEGKQFYPDYLVEIVATIAVCFQIVLVLALLDPPAIGREIDFLKPFQPRPEWYFLWLFELVGYFPGPTAVVGTVIIPLACVAGLLLIPYIDRGQAGRKRAAAVIIALLALFIGFTLLSLR